jgi:hypothetical protein
MACLISDLMMSLEESIYSNSNDMLVVIKS